ncbi:MAG: Lrp/AsnC family transcriptional regulator [Caldilineaceae bacterium]|jgi:Lrp/AsnC family leucine-responsive transcriptional regulator
MQKIDETDRKIITILQHDARISYADLGRHVNLTPPAVASRMRRLEDLGIITAYHAQINPAAFGNTITLFIRMSVPHHREKQFSHFLRHRAEVLEGYVISGEESFLLKVAVASTHHLNELLVHLIHYGQPITSLVIAQLTVTEGEAQRHGMEAAQYA